MEFSHSRDDFKLLSFYFVDGYSMNCFMFGFMKVIPVYILIFILSILLDFNYSAKLFHSVVCTLDRARV